MSAARAGLIVLVALSCGRKLPPRDVPQPLAMPPPGAEARRVTIKSGAYWTEPGGLCLQVPADWRGWSGTPPHVLSLSHDSTVTRLDVFAWPTGSPEPPMEQAWVLEFADPDGYRTVPILSPAATATWRTRERKGPTRSTWTGVVGDRQVRVQATFEFGRSVQGLDEVESLLTTLCTTFQ